MSLKKTLTVVAPVFREGAGLIHFHTRLKKVVKRIKSFKVKILYVLDPSPDDSEKTLKLIVKNDSQASALVLSARFGHQMSLLAGLENALNSEVIIMMDSDLQHPPELIPKLISKYHEGYDIVYTIRKDSGDVSLIRRQLGKIFYKTLSLIADIPINENAADFRLISNKVAHILVNECPERNLFLRGLVSWVGFNQTGVIFQAEKRQFGQSNYSVSKILKLALTGILSFSVKPLYLSIITGLLCALLAFIFILFFIISFFTDNNIPSGWTTLATLLLLFNGLNLIFLGVLGAYIGGVFSEVKSRPRYIINKRI